MTTLYSTGSTGTIGKHLPKDVRPLVIDLSQGREKLGKINFRTESNLLHLAGIVGPAEVMKDVDYARTVNVLGTRDLAEEFLERSEGIFYYVSTSHVYAPSMELILESNPLGPSNIYAEQKLEGEIELQSVFRNCINRLCIIRVFSVLDWDTAPFTLGGAIRKLTDGASDFVLANASDVRDFLTPTAISKSLYEVASQGKLSGIVNLCSGIGTSVGDAAKRMLSESDFDGFEHRFAWGQSSNPFTVGDNSRLKNAHPTLDLTWQPSTLN
jgi:nucleoside-diphosphate-sugar epimerase